MPEIVIKYKSPKTLQALRDFAKYFDFVISSVQGEKGESSIKGVFIVPGDSSIDTSELEAIFTKNHINSKTLRNEAWQKRK